MGFWYPLFIWVYMHAQPWVLIKAAAHRLGKWPSASRSRLPGSVPHPRRRGHLRRHRCVWCVRAVLQRPCQRRQLPRLQADHQARRPHRGRGWLVSRGAATGDDGPRAGCEGQPVRGPSPGNTKVATTRDHIVPLHNGGQDTVENCRPACRPCNSKRGNRNAGLVCIITGPPGAGKSTWVQEHAQAMDVVIDFGHVRSTTP